MTRLATLTEHLRSSLWFLPAVFAAAALAMASVTLLADREFGPEGLGLLHFGGSAEGARSVLATIAQSMLTFTALVFTITMLVLQLASSQLSPRVMRTFLRDRANQFVLSLFVATFIYTLVVLSEVRSQESGAEFVPGLSVFVALMLLIACVGAFIYYIDHMAHAIQATSVIESIASETRNAIERLLPETRTEAPDAGRTFRAPSATSGTQVTARSAGNVVMIDEGALVSALRDAEVIAAFVPMVGDFVPSGAPLFYVDGTISEELADRLRRMVALRSQRTLQQDVAFGFRQIVDVAVRALSPGTNDPTTAVQAIDRLHDLLRRIVMRPSQLRLGVDDDGVARLAIRRFDWDDYVDLAADEIRLSGAGQIQVVRRLRVMLEDLVAIAPDDRVPALRRQLSDLSRAAHFESARDLSRPPRGAGQDA